MGKPILLIFFIAAMLSAACQSSAESFEPLRYKITYPTPADNFYFLDLYKNNRTNIYVCSYDNNRNKGYVNVYTLNGTRLGGRTSEARRKRTNASIWTRTYAGYT